MFRYIFQCARTNPLVKDGGRAGSCKRHDCLINACMGTATHQSDCPLPPVRAHRVIVSWEPLRRLWPLYRDQGSTCFSSRLPSFNFSSMEAWQAMRCKRHPNGMKRTTSVKRLLRSNSLRTQPNVSRRVLGSGIASGLSAMNHQIRKNYLYKPEQPFCKGLEPAF